MRQANFWLKHKPRHYPTAYSWVVNKRRPTTAFFGIWCCVLAASACAAEPTSAGASPVAAKATPTQTGTFLPEALTFSGYLQGQMTAASNPSSPMHSEPSQPGQEFPARTRCGSWSDEVFHLGSFWQADIVGTVAGAAWALSVQYETSSNQPGTFKLSQFGPGYSDADADVWLQPSNRTLVFEASNYSLSDPNTPGPPINLGTLTVASDQRHGAIDVTLWDTGSHSHSVTLHGQWRCQ